METIAVFGGSFDPVTNGHSIVVAHCLLNEPDIDKVFVVPCYQQEGKNLTNFFKRYTMCRLAFENISKNVTVSTIEEELGGESVTLRTLQELKKRTKARLKFVIGSDLLSTVDSWGNWNEIKELASPLVIGRGGCESNTATPVTPKISSTEVRNLLKIRDPKVSKYIPAYVYDFIMTHNLYKE